MSAHNKHTFQPPGYKIARVCKNCRFYRPRGSGRIGRYQGICLLEQVANPKASSRITHGTCTCDAHIFKTFGKILLGIHDDYNAAIPNDREI
jgi:hypothetical protein